MEVRRGGARRACARARSQRDAVRRAEPRGRQPATSSIVALPSSISRVGAVLGLDPAQILVRHRVVRDDVALAQDALDDRRRPSGSCCRPSRRPGRTPRGCGAWRACRARAAWSCGFGPSSNVNMSSGSPDAESPAAGVGQPLAARAGVDRARSAASRRDERAAIAVESAGAVARELTTRGRARRMLRGSAGAVASVAHARADSTIASRRASALANQPTRGHWLRYGDRRPRGTRARSGSSATTTPAAS